MQQQQQVTCCNNSKQYCSHVYLPVQEIDVQVGAVELIVFQQHIPDMHDLFDLSMVFHVFLPSVGLEVTKDQST